MPKALDIDWNGIKEEYENVGTSVGVLALRFAISPGTIYAHIKTEGWNRAQTEKEEGQDDEQGDDEDILVPEPEEDPPDPAEVARLQIESTLYNAKFAVARLMKEVDRKTPQIGEIDRLIHDETMGDAVHRRRKVLRYVLTLPSRCVAMKNLAGAIKILCEVEQMMNGIAPGNRSKKSNVQAAAERLAGKFDVPDVGKIDTRKAA